MLNCAIAPLQGELVNAQAREALADFTQWANQNGQLKRDIASLQAEQQAHYAEIEALNVRINKIDRNATMQHATSLYVKLLGDYPRLAAQINVFWAAANS